MQDARETGAASKTTELRKRKLISITDATSTFYEPPSKKICVNSLEIIAEPNCVATNNDTELVNQNSSHITIDDDDTLIASSSPVHDDSKTDQRVEDSGQTAIYKTLSETFGTVASDVSSCSNINLDSSDDSVKLAKFSEENASVVFISETFPSNGKSCGCYTEIDCNLYQRQVLISLKIYTRIKPRSEFTRNISKNLKYFRM